MGTKDRSDEQNVKPDRVIFNTLITACGRAGALVRAFEVLENMRDELDGPVALDHFTYGALIAACARAGEVCNLALIDKTIGTVLHGESISFYRD